MSNTPRAWTTIAGQTEAGASITVQGQEELRTVYFEPDFARITIDKSVTPPRVMLMCGNDITSRLQSISVTAPIQIDESTPTSPIISIASASGSSAGSMSSANFTKLAGIEAAADVTDFANVSAALAAASANISVNSVRITSLADPSANSDADTKGARDTAIAVVAARATILEAPGGDYAYLPPRMAAATNATVSRVSPGSSYTHGISFFVTKSCSCIGVEGYWVVSGTETVRGEIWSPAGASLANASVSISASGIWTVTFGSAVTLTPYQLYHVTQCVSGSNATTTYNHGTTGITTHTASPIPAGHGLFINSLFRHNTTANTFPNATGAAFYPVAPRLA